VDQLAPAAHLATLLVRAGIDSISVHPNRFLAVKRCVAELEALSS
jgi:phosphoenolpyruvate-protein kinase (PTS system EI component)